MKEEVVRFGQNQSLIGIIAEPNVVSGEQFPPAVIFLNAGLIHRVGPSRIYVKLARHLADMGFVALRFDLSGVGDSSARTDNLAIENRLMDDISQAMEYLHQTRNINQFLLMGHCSGAFVSLGAATRDPRVAGIVMLNAEGGDTEWDSYDRKRKLSRYYENYYSKGVLTNPEKWKKLLTGRADYGSILRNVAKNIVWNKISIVAFKVKKTAVGAKHATTRPEIANMGAGLRSLAERGSRVLILYSRGSSGLERTRLLIGNDMRDLSASAKVKLEMLMQADHTFTLLAGQQNLIKIVSEWCRSFIPEKAATIS